MDARSSSPPSPTPPRSRFTYRQLLQLSKSSVDCPLRVVAHVDLDAFYAQCEMKRLGTGRDEPLAVQQWANLIAVNYPARTKGVTRHIAAVEAKKLCPEIRLVHVAVWRAGSTTWSYNDNEVPDVAMCKASLDPYRAESKKILAVFRSKCPDAILEKAGIDENFLDFSKPVYDRLLEEHEVLRSPPPYNDPTEYLPLPEKRKLDWRGSHLVSNSPSDGEVGELEEEGVIDWDDVAMAIGADMVRRLRDKVWGELGYTCSGGISSNKMLAKLGSGFKKPNQQSVVRPSAVQPFLDTFKFTKIRNLGGKLGTKISSHIQSESLTDLFKLSLPELASFLSEETATWVYNIIRGIDRSPVTPRTVIKSMLSAKSFRNPLPSSISDAQQWLKVFVADIWARIEDDPTVCRPKVMGFTFVPKAEGMRSRQTSISGWGIDAVMKTAENLLRQLTDGPNTWPCIRMTLDVSGFEGRELGCVEIGNFFTKARLAPTEGATGEENRLVKRVKTVHYPSGDLSMDDTSPGSGSGSDVTPDAGAEIPPPPPPELKEGEIKCDDCGASIPIHEHGEHRDWHVAKEMEKQWRQEERAAAPRPLSTQRPPLPAAKGKKLTGKAGNRGREKGQTVLKF